LVWYNQLPDWVTSTNWTADALRSVIVNHITNVVEHYKGKCYAWDVVNEGLNDDGTYRDSIFYQTLGEEYITLAYSTAQAVDPGAKLYYNDYNIESPGVKSEGVIRIINLLQGAGIRIDGVGLQSHFVASSPLSPTLDEQIAVMQSYAALGLEVALTELDVRIELPLNDTNLEWQAEGYKNASRLSVYFPSSRVIHADLCSTIQAVGACVQVEQCVGVTVWDFYDPFSWVPATFPGQGDADLWFEDFSKHPAYYGAIDALKNKTGRSCKPKRRQSREMARSGRLY
jgi:endo-1,4-beta-xylanase